MARAHWLMRIGRLALVKTDDGLELWWLDKHPHCSWIVR
jgi:hypothetical protein